MTNKVIIDGWNVCWKIPEISKLIPDNLEMARIKLNTKIKNYFQRKKVQYKIIYDGQPGIYNQHIHSRDGNIRFSKNPQKAGHLILEFLTKQEDARDWTVITSDRQLCNRASNLDAQVMFSELFINKITPETEINDELSLKENPNLNNTDMEYWLRKFGKG
jgi:predicted RNA-binding protein with PIN domain